MSAAPDPAELAPSRDPAAYGQRPLFTRTFFVWAGICAACLVVGALVGRFGFAPAGPSEPATASADIPTRSAASSLPVAPITTATPLPPANAAPVVSGDVSALAGRVARLETGATRVDAAAAEALAAVALSEAASGSGPFADDLAAYERLAPGNADLRALEPLAASGASSRTALAADFPTYAGRASAEARTPPKGASFLDRLLAALGRVVIVRNIDPAAGGADGLLARAQQAAQKGDLRTAVQDVAALPPRARVAMADWTAEAERRIEIDRRIAALRAQAMAALAQGSAQAGSAKP